MLIKLVRIDFIKLKGNFLWKLILLVPIISVILVQLLIYLQFNSINHFTDQKGVSGWLLIISQNSGPALWPSIIDIIIMIISIVVYQIEFKDNSLNTQMCFPIKKSKVFLGKFTVIYILSMFVIVINLFGLIILGKLNNVSDTFPLVTYSKYFLYQCISIAGIVSISNWVSSLFKNPLIPYVVGVIGFIIGLVLPRELPYISYVFPYSYPIYSSGLGGFDTKVAVLGGIISGALILVISIFEFVNRDIK
ncbi:ABC transporter permease [Clostridium sp. YIM B02505]|uniref:ABC transporter permease n=1 Tax=Clostridium yunnanense TaxID=2800325 RepID=A0ABS1EWS7_9CLOT|nr:ABC transporter permease [Clostridium yunnanense]MBK1813753.1 ABC transporter permease [Clostridium yunnanense]